MSVVTQTLAASPRPGGPASARLRRSPALLLGVAGAHGIAVALLLQGAVAIPVTVAVDAAMREGSVGRLQVMLLEPPSAPPDALPASLAIAPAVESVELPDVPAFEVPAEESSPAQQLRGMYLGQIRARVVRVWETFHGSPAPPLPDCIVRVVQGSRGELLDVTLSSCELDGPTRGLVQRAVRAAAPLPAPPAALPGLTTIELRLGAAT